MAWQDYLKDLAPIAAAGISAYAGSQAADKYAESTGKAADITAQATAQSVEEQRRQYDISRQDMLSMYLQAREDTAPFREAGTGAIQELQTRTAAPQAEPFSYQFEEDPGYQFRLAEMEKALSRKASAAGELGSGQYDKDLARYVGGYASDEYQRGYARSLGEYNLQYAQGRDQLSDLFQLAGYGQAGTNVGPATAANLANLGQSTASGIGSAYQNQGMVGGQLATMGGAARASSYQNIGSSALEAAKMYM